MRAAETTFDPCGCRYPSLAQRFGKNYTAAAEHFLTVGQQDGLRGHVDQFQGRYTIADVSGRLVLSASRRMGGAVDSVVFNGTEFINAHDHGRELQVAVSPLSLLTTTTMTMTMTTTTTMMMMMMIILMMMMTMMMTVVIMMMMMMTVMTMTVTIFLK